MDFVIEFIEFMLMGAFWYWVIQLVSQFLLSRHNEKRVQVKEIVKEMSNLVHNIHEETHNDIKYWYDREDNLFLAQGRDYNEIVNVLKKRFPNHLFLLNENQLLAGPDFKVIEISEESIERIVIQRFK
jgi:hypothetical protein